MTTELAAKLDVNGIDYTILGIYFAIVIAIGLLARRAVATSEDFFLSGRALPAWVTGLAFVAANLGALEILGMAANGAEYGISTVHFYWIGAVPAMVFLGLVLMPFYYSTRVHSVPEYLRRRFNRPTHAFNALTFAVASVLTAGVNLYALGLIIQSLLGWPLWLAIFISAFFVLIYITLGGLSGAIYTEVLQFFVILAGLIPLVVVGLSAVGGWGGLKDKVTENTDIGAAAFSQWGGTAVGNATNPLGDWIGIVFGLGFVLSFGYWTTNFAEVQRALSAKDLSAAQRTPLIGAFPKIFIPALTIIPGLVALVLIPKLGQNGGPTYNDAIPELMAKFLPNGVLGIALTGLLAAFMAGMAANVSSFNTVFTYDLWRPYVVKDRPDRYYLQVGRIITVIGILIGIGTAFIAAGFSNIMNYVQALFSFFNAPLFATFIVGVFWKRMTPWAGFAGLVSGTAAAVFAYLTLNNKLGIPEIVHIESIQSRNFWGAVAAFVVDVVVTVIVTMLTKPKPLDEVKGLVWGVPDPDNPDAADAQKVRRWWESPKLLGFTALGITAVLSLIFL
ncbi:sodium:solute symporter family protein [Cryptosporangium aurantiacum]|uniref:Solute:Na+ symporter, SSS family n=1 Tax=Cryptosporangium aurantiacum TaxID=134849 RepID=A0A1M7RKX2_9ACTN|nr:sodium:solute symporter family protein [Cryptosporangium aurantiacum]SHN46812.1 solute:Na+ symporter, SSS family [Cryptosporangium aurantiacum]